MGSTIMQSASSNFVQSESTTGCAYNADMEMAEGLSVLIVV